MTRKGKWNGKARRRRAKLWAKAFAERGDAGPDPEHDQERPESKAKGDRSAQA